jgi:GntR family transcriptional regulator
MVLLTREKIMPRVPKVRRIVADVQAKVASGELRSGDKLPTIDQIAADYGCSTTPVKQAIRILEAIGIVETAPGKGVYVSATPPPP